MIRYFTNRVLSQRLSINLARWKRWSREFLPPDPLGGLQSGYARQYSINDAFKVFLGGYLVAELKYAIPEAKLIIMDLTHWGEQAGLFVNSSFRKVYPHPLFERVIDWSILISPKPPNEGGSIGFNYTLRGLIEEKILTSEGQQIKEARFYEVPILENEADPTPEFYPPLKTKTLNIKRLLAQFVHCLKLEPKDFPILAAEPVSGAVPKGQS